MTQARRQGAISGHAGPRWATRAHASPLRRGHSSGTCDASELNVSLQLGLLDIRNLNGPRSVGESGVSVSSEGELGASELGTGECGASTSCLFSGGCECSQAPFSIYDGKINIPMNF